MTTDSVVPSSRRTHYWQLPMFLVGLVAVGAAYAKFPPLPDSPAQKFSRNVKSLKTALERKPLDMLAIENLASTVVSDANLDSDAAFVAGSAYLMTAEQTPTETERWKQAADVLGKIEPTKLTNAEDRKRLAYRIAKAQAALGLGDAKALIATLSDVPPGEEIDGERRRLLAESYLRSRPPEFKPARDELQAYLGSTVKQTAATLASYKQKLATIHIQLNEPEKARACLKDIGASATPVQLGKLATNENNFAEAVKHFEAVLANPALSPAEADPIRYETGMSLMRAKNPTAARGYLEDAAKGNGNIAQAANFRLAEMALREPTDQANNRKLALEQLSKAVKTIPTGVEFRNEHLRLDEARATFEEVIQSSLNVGDYGSAVKAATLYSPIALPSRATEKRAEANAAWGMSLQANPLTAASASEKFQDAATDYTTLASTFPSASGKADLLKRAAQCFRLAGNEKAASGLIDQLTQTPGVPEDIVAAAWVEKGESLLAGQQFSEGVVALRQAMTKATPTASSARVKLAVAHIDQARLKTKTAATDEAKQEVKGLMQLGRDLLASAVNATPDTPVEKEAHQLALFELGKLNLAQSDIAEAESRFRQLLQSYPTGTQSGPGRLYLGSCLLLMARGDHQGGRPPADADTKLNEARKHFETLSESTDPFLRTQADIRLANTTLLLRKYDEMPSLCEKLIKRHEGKIEELIILSMLYSAYHFADRLEPAAGIRVKMLELFQKLPETAFPGGAEEYTRDYWQREWFAPLKSKK
jgi:hypothetical protein